jgi:hypothetical protein
MLYLMVFALGILANWSAGHVPLAAGAAIYFLTIGLVVYLATRRLTAALVSALFAAILAPAVTALGMQFIGKQLTNATQLGLYVFALYLICGTLFVLALALGRRLARPRFDTLPDTQHNK